MEKEDKTREESEKSFLPTLRVCIFIFTLCSSAGGTTGTPGST